jgi:hypothetical protein
MRVCNIWAVSAFKKDKNIHMKFSITLLMLVFCFSVTGFAQQDTLKQYTGKYKFAEGSVIAEAEVTYTDSTLTMNTSAGTSVLKFEKNDQFAIVSFDGTAVFTRNAERKITGVHIEAMGYVLDGTKEETKGWAATGLLLRDKMKMRP